MFTKNVFTQKDTVADAISQIAEGDYKNKMEELKGNQHKIDMNKNNKIDAQDFKMLRSKKKNEEVEIEEAQSHQAGTTMKHISNPTAGEKKAAKDIKPGVAGYRDRIAMLKSAEARGALKKEEAELDEAKVASGSPFSKDYKSQAPSKPGEKAGFTSKKISTGTVYSRKPAKPETQKEEVEQVEERMLTPGETAEKERIVKGMKKSLKGFKQRYGERAKEVMYATATKAAKENK